MPDSGSIDTGFWFGIILAIISLIAFLIGICDCANNKSSAGAALIAWVLLAIGGSLICISVGYSNLGKGWSAPPVEGKYRVRGERQGYMGLAPIDKPDYKAVGHDFDPRTIYYVDVMPQDKRAGTTEIIGPHGHRRITIYVIKQMQVKNPGSIPEKEKLKTSP